MRLLGGMHAAEEALHGAFVAAAEQWPTPGVPANPRVWLVSVGRFKAIDKMRRQPNFVSIDAAPAVAEAAAAVPDEQAPSCEQQGHARQDIEGDRLRLIFTCRHPSLAKEVRIAVPLRAGCGLPTEAIAAAFLIATPTPAQRAVRAKAKILAAGIPYEKPVLAKRASCLASGRRVIYLVLREGYLAYAGAAALRSELAVEAIGRVRRPLSLMPGEPGLMGLLARVQRHHARNAARCTAAGDPVPLEEQHRTHWDHRQIAEAAALTEAALRQRGFWAYALQAAIAAVHAEAAEAAATDWPQIVGLYDALLRSEPSPVVALNRAVVVAMRDGPEAGLARRGPLLLALPDYHLAFAVMADLCRRAGRIGSSSRASDAPGEPHAQAHPVPRLRRPLHRGHALLRRSTWRQDRADADLRRNADGRAMSCGTPPSRDALGPEPAGRRPAVCG